MKKNPVINTLLNHKSIRKYTEEMPSDEMIETIVRAGQQAPFSYQMYSVLLSRNKEKNPWKAPLCFTICVDFHKFELIMKKRNWKPSMSQLELLIFGVQEAAYMAENMVIAGESMGLGTCFLGNALFKAEEIAEEYDLPKKVLPTVYLVMGYPAEDKPIRPRYPMEYTLFENKYPKLEEDLITKAMQIMDDGYLAEDYYHVHGFKIPLKGEREETFTWENYSWTEHISRKIGTTGGDEARGDIHQIKNLRKLIEKRGFNV
jgi:nitroreductase